MGLLEKDNHTLTGNSLNIGDITFTWDETDDGVLPPDSEHPQSENAENQTNPETKQAGNLPS